MLMLEAALPEPVGPRTGRPATPKGIRPGLTSWRRRSKQNGPLVGLQCGQQGSGVVGEVVDGAGPGEVPGRGGHPEGEVVVGDFQFHGAVEEGQDGGVEVSAGEEVESGAVGSVVEEDPDQPVHDGVGVVHEF